MVQDSECKNRNVTDKPILKRSFTMHRRDVAQLVHHHPHRSGLEGQLLGVTIQHEQPELEKAKSEMLREEEGFKVSV